MELRSISSKYKNSSEVTVVSSSSRSPTTMSSNELPRTPSPVPMGPEETHGGSSGQSKTGVSSGMSLPFAHSPLKGCHPRPSNRKSISGFREAASDAIDPKFIKNHLKPPPPINISNSIRKSLDDICNSKNEHSMYKPAGKALTAISKEFFSELSSPSWS